jgi:hypothetical protein
MLVVGATLVMALATCGDRGRSPEPETGEDTPLDRGQQMVQLAASCHTAELLASLEPCRGACELGHSNSCARVGAALQATGDRAGAIAMAQRGCRGGSGTGCEAAADLTLDADPAAARVLERQARTYHRVHCEQGYVPSCVALARMFDAGRGGPADAAVAAHYRRRACQLGARDACGDD